MSISQIVIFSNIYHVDKKSLDKRLDALDVKITKFDDTIMNSSNIILQVEYPKLKISVYNHDDHYHAYIQHPRQSFTIEDRGFVLFYDRYFIAFYIVLMFMFFVTYYILIKRNIQIQKGRDIFISNIMHELKTPITKGIIVTTTIDDIKSKERLQRVFDRMQILIDEFANIEKLNTNQKIEKKVYKLSDIVDNAIDLMMDDYDIIQEYVDTRVEVNYNLFSIAIKNMIDNGIKHSSDKKVKIVSSSEYLIGFCSEGDRLEHDISYYIEPFVKSSGSNSFGLGLYIVSYILSSHDMKLKYRYIDGYNYFLFVD
jgi:hypothetical protein